MKLRPALTLLCALSLIACSEDRKDGTAPPAADKEEAPSPRGKPITGEAANAIVGSAYASLRLVCAASLEVLENETSSTKEFDSVVISSGQNTQPPARNPSRFDLAKTLSQPENGNAVGPDYATATGRMELLTRSGQEELKLHVKTDFLDATVTVKPGDIEVLPDYPTLTPRPGQPDTFDLTDRHNVPRVLSDVSLTQTTTLDSESPMTSTAIASHHIDERANGKLLHDETVSATRIKSGVKQVHRERLQILCNLVGTPAAPQQAR